MFGLSKIAIRIIAAVAAVALLLGVLQVRSCMRANQEAAQDRVDQAQDAATGNSAQDAIATQGQVAGNAVASEAITAQNERNIRNAQGADQSVDPALRDAGFAGLCQRASFRNSPTGRVRCPPAP